MGKLLCEKIYGTFGVEMRAYGQNLVKFCKHTRLLWWVMQQLFEVDNKNGCANENTDCNGQPKNV